MTRTKSRTCGELSRHSRVASVVAPKLRYVTNHLLVDCVFDGVGAYMKAMRRPHAHVLYEEPVNGFGTPWYLQSSCLQ